MRHLKLPENHICDVPFFLAAEEYAVTLAADGDLFFLWQVEPSVIFGRNQLIENEVNLDYCREHGIRFHRRRSGGGCVYADRDNIMFSYITARKGDVSGVFRHYTGAVVEMLRSLGIDASDNSRNDILIGQSKVSGNAFYRLGDCSIVHGTMLFDTNFEHIARAITPSRAKLESKGVKSVPSHVTTLSRHLDIDIERFKQYAIDHLTDGEVTLGDNDLEQILRLREPYLSQEFVYGSNPRGNVTRQARIDGVGEIAVSISLNHNRVSDIALSGDYFQLADPGTVLRDRLHGTQFAAADVEQALSGVDLSQYIASLSTKQFIEILFN